MKGKLFDEWHGIFYVKMCQAKVGNTLEKDYVPPNKNDDGYELYKVKDDFLKNHLLTATMGSNASSFINVKTMTGVEMYKHLLDVFQGLQHDEDAAVNATTTWEKLKFNKHSRYSPETFLSKVNECLKRMEIPDSDGRTTKPFSEAMLPSLLRAKIDHPSFSTWKALSEKDKDDWETTQVTFLHEAHKNFEVDHDSSSKFRRANQKSEEAKGLSEKERKVFDKALKEGKHFPGGIFKKLSDKEKDDLKKAKTRKWNTRNNGGLGSQYSANQHLSTLPSGTMLVPVMPQGQKSNSHNQVNNTIIEGVDNSDHQATIPANGTNQESNKVRAANFLQLANGNFVVQNSTFQLSSRASERMSVQSFKQ